MTDSVVPEESGLFAWLALSRSFRASIVAFTLIAPSSVYPTIAEETIPIMTKTPVIILRLRLLARARLVLAMLVGAFLVSSLVSVGAVFGADADLVGLLTSFFLTLLAVRLVEVGFLTPFSAEALEVRLALCRTALFVFFSSSGELDILALIVTLYYRLE
jgi:hypothetical protein